jgi:hypothetical protein
MHGSLHAMLLALPASVTCACARPALHSSTRSVPRRSRLPALVLNDDPEPWRDEEDWALLDATPEFTVGEGAMAATFWTALSSSNAALCQRSPAECAQRAAQLAQNSTTLEFGREPKVLDAWSRLADGRVVGRLDARTVWLTVETEGRLASDPRSSAGYIETIGGRVYELGEPAASREASGEASGSSALPPVATSDGSFGAELQRWGVLKGVVRRHELTQCTPLP